MARMLPPRRTNSNKEPMEFLQEVMTQTLTALRKKDVYDLFSHPVDVRSVPDYLEKVSTPMDFSTIEKKISRRHYASFDEFKIDVVVVFNNAQNYNMEHTVYFREATKLAQVASVLFHDADVALDANKRQYRAYASSPSKRQAGTMHPIAEVSNGPDTQMEMDPPTFDLGILRPTDPLPPQQQDDYFADSEGDNEPFHDVCTQDLEGYHTDDSYVFDAVIHDPEPDPREAAIPKIAPRVQRGNDVSDIDSDDSSLSDGIEFMHDYAAPTPSAARDKSIASPSQLPRPLDKENIVPTPKQQQNRRDTSGWIPRKRVGMDNTMSQPAKRPASSSSSIAKKTPYKSIFGLQPPPPRSRQALMDVFVVHPTAD